MSNFIQFSIPYIIKILKLYILLSCTHFYHIFTLVGPIRDNPKLDLLAVLHQQPTMYVFLIQLHLRKNVNCIRMWFTTCIAWEYKNNKYINMTWVNLLNEIIAFWRHALAFFIIFMKLNLGKFYFGFVNMFVKFFVVAVSHLSVCQYLLSWSILFDWVSLKPSICLPVSWIIDFGPWIFSKWMSST